MASESGAVGSFEDHCCSFLTSCGADGSEDRGDPARAVLESLEKFVDMLSGMHRQMPEDPKVLEIAGVHQVQLVDRVAECLREETGFHQRTVAKLASLSYCRNMRHTEELRRPIRETTGAVQ